MCLRERVCVCQRDRVCVSERVCVRVRVCVWSGTGAVSKAGLTIGLEWARAHGPRPIGGPTRFRSFDLFIFQLRFVYWSGIDNNPAMLKE